MGEKKGFAIMKKLKWFHVLLLIIFYPVGIVYLVWWIIKKKSASAPVQNPNEVHQNQATQNPQQFMHIPSYQSQSDVERLQRRQAFIARKQAEFTEQLNSIPRVAIELSDEKRNRKTPSDFPEIKFLNITRATKIETIFPLVVIDIETTGLQVRGNDIIELSAIKYDVGFQPVSCFTTLLKPRKPIPAEASAVNHITDDMVKDCPPFSAVASSFSEYISGCNVAGHNLNFDLKFLFVCGADLPEKSRYYDTLMLAKKTLTAYGSKKYDYHTGEYSENYDYDVDDYKLETLCDYYNIYRNDAHRSLSDCFATAKLLEYIISDKVS